ncbi:MAG: hypothetical protein ACI4SS_02275 [Clostridia bacterium]
MKKNKKILVKYYITLLGLVLDFAVLCLGFAAYFDNAPKWQQLLFLVVVGFGGFIFCLYQIYRIVATKEFQEYEKDVAIKKRDNKQNMSQRWRKVLIVWGAAIFPHTVLAIYLTIKYGNSYARNIGDIIAFIIAISAIGSIIFFLIALWWYLKKYKR